MGAFDGYALPRDIVMISTADWDETLWTNKQQIASRLVPDFRVLYVEPLKSFRSGKRKYTKKAWRDERGVQVYRPAVALPFGQKLEAMNEINHRLVAQPLREYIGDIGFEEYILWVYTPNGFPYLGLLKPMISCYDCVDEYSAFPGVWKGTTLKMEAKLLQSVDVVFTTAQSLYETKKEKNPNTHYIPNVGDFDMFNQAATCEPARQIKEIKGPVIGFVGAVNYKLDRDLLEQLFELRPDWSFVIIGPDRGFGVERFANTPNVHFLGFKPQNELPMYMAGFDVCMIPYKVDAYTAGVMPIKFFEYLATGKPVVTTAIPELARFSELIDLAPNADTFVEAIEKNLKHDSEQRRGWRMDLAKSNSWETRIKEILDRLEDTYRKMRFTK